MSFRGIKRNLTDKLFSDIVRERAKWICEWCQRSFENRPDIFDCSHFYTRANKRVRWDFSNASALCRGCHDFMGKHPLEHTEFMKKKLGEKWLKELQARATIRALTASRVDEKEIRIGLKEEWARMQKEKKAQIIGSR